MAGEIVETRVNDPLLYTAPLPYQARYYPTGFPVEVATNAPEVLHAAEQSWGMYGARFDRPPIRVHILVSERHSGLPPAPRLRGQRHLVLWVSDQDNFSVCDRRERFAYSSVTRATVADSVFFRWHFLEAVVYMLLEITCYTSIHAGCVAWNGIGVLLSGESGVGKSTLAYACARRGWTYVCDDSSSVVWGTERSVVGEWHRFRFRADAAEIFPELRGLTAGRELDRKPTIEVLSSRLPIATAEEARVERLVFLERSPGQSARVTRIGTEQARERMFEDTAVLDPETEVLRTQARESVLEVPGYLLHYGSYEEAVALLEQLVRQ